jgi:hypothetical protein
MTYSAQDTSVLEAQARQIIQELDAAIAQTIQVAGQQQDEVAKYLRNGVGRRLHVIRLSIQKVYQLFPPNQAEPLPIETIHEVQVYLQAFVINVAGIFDTFAWAFVLKHRLLEKVGGQIGIGMFVRKTQKCLPPSIKTYVTTNPIKSWHRRYIKDFRDALAHRIPLYVPPYLVNPRDADEYHRLNVRKSELMAERDWDEYDRVEAEQNKLCKALPAFMGDFVNPEVYFHPQLNSDGATVLEFTKKFYDGWHEFVLPQKPPFSYKAIFRRIKRWFRERREETEDDD